MILFSDPHTPQKYSNIHRARIQITSYVTVWIYVIDQEEQCIDWKSIEYTGITRDVFYFRTFINNYTHIKLLGVITHPCPNFKAVLLNCYWSYNKDEQLYPTETCGYNHLCLSQSRLNYVSKTDCRVTFLLKFVCNFHRTKFGYQNKGIFFTLVTIQWGMSPVSHCWNYSPGNLPCCLQLKIEHP